MNLGLESLEFQGEPTDKMSLGTGKECKGWRVVAEEGVAQAVESRGTEKVVRKDWKAVAEEMAQARWGPEEVVARPLGRWERS